MIKLSKRSFGAVQVIEQHISQRDLSLSELVAKLIENSSSLPKTELAEYTFVGARVWKICQFPGDQDRIRAALRDVVSAVKFSNLPSSKEVAQFLWSCRILNLKPNLALSTVDFTQATNKEISNAVWALSKWAKDDPAAKKLFHELVELCADRVSSFSNQDLTALARCLALTVDTID